MASIEQQRAMAMAAARMRAAEFAKPVLDSGDKMGALHENMLNNAGKAMSSQGPKLLGIPFTEGVPAQFSGMASRATGAIPFADEAISGVAATLGGGKGKSWKERYDNRQQEQQAMREAMGHMQDTVGFGNDLRIGPSGLAQFGILAGLSPFAPGGVQSAPASLKEAVGKGAGVGGAYGAVYGAGETNSFLPDDEAMLLRGQNLLKGGGGGILAGSALGGLGYGLTKIPKGKPGGGKADRLAAKQLEKMAQRDKVNVNTLAPDESLLSTGNKASTSRAEAIVTRDNAAGDKITDYAYGRKAELPLKLSERVGTQFPEANYPKLLENVERVAKKEAGPGYQKAYDALTKISDPQIDQTLDRVVRAGDWPVLVSEARKLAAYEGHSLGRLDKKSGAILDFSTKDLDYMTRALRNLGQGTEGAGAFGGKTPLGAMRKNAAMDIRGRLKELNPAFGEATSKYADKIAISEAAEAGKAANLFGSGWKQIVHDVKKLPEAAQKAWRIGQAENLHTMIANNPQAALRRFNSPQFGKVMSEFFSPDELLKLQTSLAKKAKEMGAYQRVLGNSRTAGRAVQQLEDQSLVQEGPRQAIVETVKRGPYGATKKALGDFLEKKLLNTPTLQKADERVASVLTASPFKLGSMESIENLPPVIRNAIAKMGGKSAYGFYSPNSPFFNSELLRSRNLGILAPYMQSRESQ
jgi:hypothetical protein